MKYKKDTTILFAVSSDFLRVLGYLALEEARTGLENGKQGAYIIMSAEFS